MATIEKKIFSDGNERLNQNEKTNQKLAELDQRVNNMLDFEAQKIDQSALKDAIVELEGKEKNPEELLSMGDDTKKIVVGKKQSSSLSLQKRVEDTIGNENPVANQGRVSAYTNVADFADQVSSQGGVFSKLVGLFS